MSAETRWAALALGLAIAVYLVASLSYLTVFPPVGEDEPWIAAAPFKLATQGTYGSDLFTGYYGIDKHDYQRMPLYPMLEAATFWLFGMGVLQMRLLSVVLGLALLLVVCAVGRFIGGDRVGVIASVLMVAQRITGGSNQIGILLLDRARIARNDIAVPVFGLLAWLLFERAEAKRSPVLYVGSGILIGCASLSHLYGGFWLVAVLFVLITRRSWRESWTPVSLIVVGLVVTWVPWLMFIASGWSDYFGQQRTVASRFQLTDLEFYLANILSAEGPIGLEWAWRTLSDLSWTRAGTWFMVAGVPTAIVLVARQGRQSPIATVGEIFVVQLLLFLVLIRVKHINYMIALWPMAALLLAWLLVSLWDRRHLAPRLAAAILVVWIVAEGTARLVATARVAATMMPAEFYADQIANCIPPGSRVLGFQHYWVGRLRQFPYRTWHVPLNMTHPAYHDPRLRFDEALDQVGPDVILVDRHIRDLLHQTRDPESEYHYVSLGFDQYTQRHPLEPLCVVRDRTYGTMEVYRVR